MTSTPHESARSHVSGEAEYIDDRPFTHGELHVGLVLSPVARGSLNAVHFEAAAKVPGVAGIFTAKDIAHNMWGSIFADQPFLVEREILYAGEVIAVIAAESVHALEAARRLVQLDISPVEPILTLDQAIARREFIGPERHIERGKVDEALKAAPHRLKGTLEIAGQDHFYLESQACVVYPREDRQLEIHSSSQHPSEVQHLVAHALGLKFHQVVCVVKRMGGAFGGKESQAAPFAVYASLVASRLNRPARLILSKDDDMRITGKRNPFKNFYEVGFDNKGKILALKANLYSDGGAYADLSTAIMERAMLHTDNAYFIPNFSVSGQVCRTHTAPNTAFRGFGGPKGVVTIESIIEDIAAQLKLDPLDVRQANVYAEGQTTPYGQTIDDAVLPDLFAKLRRSAEYDQRRQEIEQHNQESSSTYRGLSMTAVKFGISFTTRFLNQGSALVNIHLDGTIQVSTGATEMGQGVNTKIAQVVADAFSIPVSDVRVMPTSTEKNANTSATAASSGADINGQAALNACLNLRTELAKVAQEVLKRSPDSRGRKAAAAGTVGEIAIDGLPEAQNIVFKSGHVFDYRKPDQRLKFADLVNEAYLNRIPLSASGFFRYPGIFFNKETGQGKPFFYFTNGVALSEVSADRLTGEIKVLRADVLMDLGRPLNHGIDQGQVTGGFIQGMGWLTTENLFYDKGVLLSCSPSTYKIPSVHDVPREFNCSLLENPRNDRNLRGSKTAGEPPLLLAISVWTAIKNALTFARKGVSPNLGVPATQEKVFFQLPRGDDGGLHEETL